MKFEDFKIGDVVRLKSGGVKMTVTALGRNDYQTVTCVFFDGQNEADELTVNYQALVKVIERKRKLARTNSNEY